MEENRRERMNFSIINATGEAGSPIRKKKKLETPITYKNQFLDSPKKTLLEDNKDYPPIVSN